MADGVDDLHPAHDTTEHGMLPVQPVVVDDVDEELAPAGVRTRVRHRDRSPRIPVVGRELVFDRVSGAAEPGSLRVSTLDHEVRDHAVEDCSIVEALPDELPEVPRRDGHRLVEELDLHVAHRGLEEDGRHAAAMRFIYVKGGGSLFRRRTNQVKKICTMTATTIAMGSHRVMSAGSALATTVTVHSLEATSAPSDTVTF